MAEPVRCGRRVAKDRPRETACIELRAGLEAARIAERGRNLERAGGVAFRPYRLPGVGVARERERGAERGARPNPRAHAGSQRKRRRHETLRLQTDVGAEQRRVLLANQAAHGGRVAVVAQIAGRNGIDTDLHSRHGRELHTAGVLPRPSLRDGRGGGVPRLRDRHKESEPLGIAAHHPRAEMDARRIESQHLARHPDRRRVRRHRVVEIERVARAVRARQRRTRVAARVRSEQRHGIQQPARRPFARLADPAGGKCVAPRAGARRAQLLQRIGAQIGAAEIEGVACDEVSLERHRH